MTEDHDLIFNDESKFGIFQCSEVLDGSFNYTRAPKQMVIKEDCVIRIGAFNSLFRFFLNFACLEDFYILKILLLKFLNVTK